MAAGHGIFPFFSRSPEDQSPAPCWQVPFFGKWLRDTLLIFSPPFPEHRARRRFLPFFPPPFLSAGAVEGKGWDAPSRFPSGPNHCGRRHILFFSFLSFFFLSVSGRTPGPFFLFFFSPATETETKVLSRVPLSFLGGAGVRGLFFSLFFPPECQHLALSSFCRSGDESSTV